MNTNLPAKFKIKKRFVDADRKEYNRGDTIVLNNRIKIDRMIYYGIIDRKPYKKRGRKPKTERAVVL